MTLRDSGNPDAAADLRPPDEEEFASAALDPIAAQALKMMARCPVTARDVAEATSAPLEEASRQLEELRRAGLISAHGGLRGEGKAETLYDGPFVPFLDREEWAQLDPDERRFHLGQIANLLIGDIDTALEAKTLEAWPHFHLCRMPFRMDDRGWEEMRAVYDDALEKAVRIREEAIARLQNAGELGKRGMAAQVLFELPDRD